MAYLIQRGVDAPHQPRLLGDEPLFRDGRLIGVRRRLPRLPVTARANSEFRVLVVDDTKDMADLCSECLVSWGFQVTTAYGSREGFAAAQELIPDAILLNYLMPGWNGLEVMHMLRAGPRTARIKVILDSIEPIGELALRMGADDFLLLPFETQTLLEKVSRAVRS